MSKSFDDLLERLSQVEKKKVSVAVAQDDEVVDPAFQLIELVDNVVVTPCRKQGCHQEKYRPDDFFHINYI